MIALRPNDDASVAQNMIGHDEIALNAVDCHLRTSICVSHRSSHDTVRQ
jgi:hypothetical protein